MAHGKRAVADGRRVLRGLRRHVTPTIAALPAPLGELDQNRQGMTAMEWTRQVFAYVPFTPPSIRPASRDLGCRSTGVPAVSRSACNSPRSSRRGDAVPPREPARGSKALGKEAPENPRCRLENSY